MFTFVLRKPMKATINGETWKIIFKVIPPRWTGKGKSRQPVSGWCRPDSRVIEIDSRNNTLATLDTVIHEFTHASQYDLSEEKVSQIGSELAELLWRLGYRRVEV